MMCWRSDAHRPACLKVLGLFLVGLGVVCCLFWHRMYKALLDMNLTFSPNAVYYDEWKTPSDAIELNAYFFNWTNPEDFLNTSTKPILKECGPYSFMERPEKIDVKWHTHNDSVSYRIKTKFYFDAARSRGSLSDVVVAQNVVAMTAASKTKEFSATQSRIVSMGLDLFDQRRYVRKTVDELFLSGYHDNIIALAHRVPIFGNGGPMPDRFGWFYGINGSSEINGAYNMHAGTGNADMKGKMNTWNYANHTGFFKSHCGMVNGSAGELYPPNLTPESIVHIFSPEVCRSLPLDYAETVKVDGLTAYKYVAGPRYLDNGTLYPENECLCRNKCYPSGVTDVSRCRLEAPLFISLPHFLQADPYYLNSVEGMEPNKSLHELYIIVEPTTGTALEVAARLQLNLLVEPVDNIRLYKNVPRVFFPLIWLEKRWRLSPRDMTKLKWLKHVFWLGYIAGSIVFATGLLILRRQLDPNQKKPKSNTCDSLLGPDCGTTIPGKGSDMCGVDSDSEQ